MSESLFNSHTTEKLPPVGKDFMCFQIDGKYAQEDKCVKFRIMTNVVDCVLSTDKLEQQCFVLKGILQSPCLKDHMKTIGIEQ